jgi:molybdopterin/thiamine biosynthesis adenylyltransferase
MFLWIAAAKRLLSLDELREAVALEIGMHHLDAARLYNEMDRVTSWCGSLVEVDEEYGLVQFAHSSIRQFLWTDTLKERLQCFHFQLTEADHQARELCLTYLHLSNFTRAANTD